ncbi:phage tail family protein [Sporolactobacillus shoreicorticis]|nr:phage tail family protein [Sporolactobacillus shoreicorticis]MCO7128364.1 phage tail family protein [Sporolactobacillus shoreicorticis]
MGIEEGFYFNGTHTKDYGMSLKERQAPTPEEKTITEEVPFMQGNYDFSMILGERIFKNRTLSYTFEAYQRDYQYRKVDEIVLKNWLMKPGFGKLVDDHDKGYYWWAKCTSVDVDDDHPFGRLLITLEFEAYPFMRGELEEGNDLWDPFNFLLDYAQPVTFDVDGSLTVNLMNLGSVGVVPTITASEAMEIVKNGTTYQVPSGQSKSESFRLEIGENPMTVSGTGTIKFSFYKELI